MTKKDDPKKKKQVKASKAAHDKKKKTLTYKASKKDSIKNPQNQEFVNEVAFNKGIKPDKVTQEQFNKRYGIKY